MSSPRDYEQGPKGRSVEALVRRGAGWKAASEVFTQLFQILVGFALVRLLTPDEYGLAAMALVFSGFVLVFADLAFGAALVQRKDITEHDRSTTFWLGVGSGALMTLVGIGLAEPMARFFGEPALRDLVIATSFGFIITSFGGTQRALLTREMDFRRLELRIMIATFCGGAVGLAVAFSGYGAWAIIMQYLVFATVSTVFMWITTPWRPHFVFSVSSVRNLGGFSMQVLGNRLLYTLNETGSSLLIGRLLGSEALGLYTVARNVVLTPLSRVAVPIAEVLFPAFSKLQSDRTRIATMWLRGLPLLAAVVLPSLAGLVIVAPDFVTVVLGERWEDVTPLIQVLAVVGVVSALHGWSASILMGIGHAGVLVRYTAYGVVVVLLAIGVGYRFGILGVVVANAVFATALTIPYTRVVTRLVGVPFRDVARALSGVTQATALMAGAILLGRIALVSIGAGPAARLALLVPLGAAVFLLAFNWRAPGPWDDAVGTLRSRFRRRRSVAADVAANQGTQP